MKTTAKLFEVLEGSWHKLASEKQIQFIDFLMEKASDVMAAFPETREEYELLKQEILAKAA